MFILRRATPRTSLSRLAHGAKCPRARSNAGARLASRAWCRRPAAAVNRFEGHPSAAQRLDDVAGEGFHGGRARLAGRAVGAHADLVDAAGEERLAARD